MRRFRYALDPLCLAAIGAYVLSRWVIQADFLRGWFHDVLMIPAALPLFLWFERKLGIRQHDRPPSPREIVFYVVVWSFAAEVIGPRLFPWATGDWLDVLCYSAGGLLAWGFWSTSAPGSGCRGARDRGKASGP